MTTFTTITFALLLSIAVFGIHKYLLNPHKSNVRDLEDRINVLEFLVYQNKIQDEQLKQEIKDLETEVKVLKQKIQLLNNKKRPIAMHWSQYNKDSL